MENTKISEEQLARAEQAIIEGQVEQFQQFLADFQGHPLLSRWEGAIRARASGGDDLQENARAIIAHTHHFDNWPDYVHFQQLVRTGQSEAARFEAATEAVISGDITRLDQLLQHDPDLIHARSPRRHHATLLHYVGANGVEDFRQKTPPNAVAVAKTLLRAGAEVNAIGDMYRGSSTLGLVATSVHPVKAGVQEDLIDLLLAHGAELDLAVAPDYTEGNLVVACLHNGRGEAAAYLAQKGAPLDLEGAAGTGMLAEVKKYYHPDGGLIDQALAEKRDLGFMWACEYGHNAVIDFLLQQGFDLSTMASGMTALHWAALGRKMDVVKKLLALRAPLEIENGYGGTVLSQALWAAYHDPQPEDAQLIALLIESGAKVEPDWQVYIDEIRAR